jgi:G:T/U-mismatch repair DNA glycosylase
MWFHKHPYPPFIPETATRLILGTLPPPRFSTGNLNAQDVDFCYGSSNGMLWKIWNRLYDLKLDFENTHFAIEQRKAFLKLERFGICDIVGGAYRHKIDASDLGMHRVQLRDILSILEQHPKVDTLIFTGGNSKNGPEYFFRKILKKAKIPFDCLDNQVPRIHQFNWAGRNIKTHSLTAPSKTANRAIGSMQAYKEAKQRNQNYNTLDFRVEQYRVVFNL